MCPISISAWYQYQPLWEASEAPALGLTPKGGLVLMQVKKWKISKIAATKCHIVRIKCTKFNFHWGFAPDPIEGAYSDPQTLSCI